MAVFTALRFQTANARAETACAVGAVRVERGVVVERYQRLFRPETRRFDFRWVHGIGLPDVAGAPSFRRAWPELRALLRGVDFVLAHDASIDGPILEASCAAAGVAPPRAPIACTLGRARAWGLRPPTLASISKHLRIPFRERGAAVDDAEACAAIALASGLGTARR